MDAEKFPRPLYTRENELAVEVWNFCGACWKPEVLPLAMEYHDVRDPDFLIRQLLALRDFYANRAERVRQATAQ